MGDINDRIRNLIEELPKTPTCRIDKPSIDYNVPSPAKKKKTVQGLQPYSNIHAEKSPIEVKEKIVNRMRDQDGKVAKTPSPARRKTCFISLEEHGRMEVGIKLIRAIDSDERRCIYPSSSLYSSRFSMFMSLTSEALILRESEHQKTCSFSFNFISRIKIHANSEPYLMLIKFIMFPADFCTLNLCLSDMKNCSEYLFEFHYSENVLKLYNILGETKLSSNLTCLSQQQAEYEKLTSTAVKAQKSSKQKDAGDIEYLPPSRYYATRSRKPVVDTTVYECNSSEDEGFKSKHNIELFVYPFSGLNSITIFKNDLRRLHGKHFLNDTIIDFYLRYLFDQQHPEVKKKIHIFDTFFYKKLTDRNESSKTLNEAYEAMKSWTKDVNVFEKDVLVVPVNEKAHWYVVFIINPAKAFSSASNSPSNEEKDNCQLFVVDSLHRSRSGVLANLKQFLACEAKAKYQKDIKKAIGFHLKGPLQRNSYDCGLFLIQAVESFLLEPDFILKANDNQNFFNEVRSWFPAELIRGKRRFLFDLIIQTAKRYALETGNSSHFSSEDLAEFEESVRESETPVCENENVEIVEKVDDPESIIKSLNRRQSPIEEDAVE